MANRIHLKGDELHKEAPAVTVITPGDLLDRVAGGFQRHAVAAGNAIPMFALENSIVGQGIDSDYPIGDNVVSVTLSPGSEVYALVSAAAAAIAVGDFLESDGTGKLRKAVVAAATSQAQRSSIVAKSLQALDNSGGGTTARLKVEAI